MPNATSESLIRLSKSTISSCLHETLLVARRGPSGLAAPRLFLRLEFQLDQVVAWNIGGGKGSKVDYQTSLTTHAPVRNAGCGWRACA